MKRENDNFLIKDLINLFIKENKLEKEFQKINIKEAWNKVMGAGVVSYTREVQLQNSTLIVALSSSALREELSYGKDKIIKMINTEMGKEVINKLILA